MSSRFGGFLDNELTSKAAKIRERVARTLTLGLSRGIAFVEPYIRRVGFGSSETLKRNLSELPATKVRLLSIAVTMASVGLISVIWFAASDGIDWHWTSIAVGSFLAFLGGSLALWRAAHAFGLDRQFIRSQIFSKLWIGISRTTREGVSLARTYTLTWSRVLASGVSKSFDEFRARLDRRNASETRTSTVEEASSDRLPIENAVQQSPLEDLQVLELVLSGMSDGVIVLDVAGNCSHSNQAADTICGKTLNGISIYNWETEFGLRQTDSSPFATNELPFVRALQGTAVKDAQICLEAGSGHRRTFSVSAMPLTDASGRVCGAVGMLRAATERNSVEEALNKAKEAAEQANQAKSEFLSRMSHELRTPLNAILGFAQLLDMARLPGQHHDSIQQILKAGQHLLELINEVLDVARIESGRLTLSVEQLVALEVVQETVALIESQAAKRNIQLYIEAGPSWRSPIRVDRQRFKQVLLNLLSNAVKYNSDGGSVHISTEIRNQYLRLNVTDTGQGITKEQFNLLFNPFERLGAEQSGVEGTGIGLALSKRLTEAMTGRIGAISESGKGSTFWIEFPVAETSPKSDSSLLRLSRSVASQRQTVVLCIEDNDSNYCLIERTLAQRPEVKLLSGKLGASALSLAENNLPDLILLDMHLPDLQGDQVLSILKNHPTTAEIPVVVISADASPGIVDQMLRAGAHAYLTKPLDIANLLEVVDKVLEVGTAHTEPCFEI